MKQYEHNPFEIKTQKIQHQIWEMLVRRDIDAFLKQDWSMVNNDFIEAEFYGVDAQKSNNPDNWKMNFFNLESYKIEWLKQAKEFAQQEFKQDARKTLFELTELKDIEIKNNRAIAHKKFDGKLTNTDDETSILNWQTLYYCKQVMDNWKICGFTGYMPYIVKK